MPAMPLFLYPTMLLCIDDDALFLQAVTEVIKDRHAIKTYPSYEEAMSFFQNYESTSSYLAFLRGYREYEEYDLNNHFPVDINFNTILNLRKNQRRLKDIAVIIVDYNMPGKSGIELCRELQKLPIKKILLTGEANHQIAVSAFNEGIINRFIRKDEPLLPTALINQVKEMNIQYFCDLTKPLLAHLEADYKLPQSDPVFINFFDEWCQENQIREYYLIDKNGTFLTINGQGQIHTFVIHTDRTLNIFADTYTNDKEASLFIQAVRHRNKIPFFGLNKESWNFETLKWSKYFYSPQILDGRERYYWAAIESNIPYLMTA